jgi:hypothetical protein
VRNKTWSVGHRFSRVSAITRIIASCLILMFLTPRRKKIEADGAQESRPASSSTIFFTNLAQKGFGGTASTTTWILATDRTAWQKYCLVHIPSMSATGSDSYFHRILSFSFWVQMVGSVSLLQGLWKVAGLGSRSLVEVLSSHGLSQVLAPAVFWWSTQNLWRLS